MKKLFKIKIKGEEDLNLEVQGIKNDNKFKYLENDMMVLITTLKNKIIMERHNSDYQVTLNFESCKKTISTYEFVGGNKKFYLETFTHKLLITNNKIYIKYNLEGNDFEFTLEVI